MRALSILGVTFILGVALAMLVPRAEACPTCEEYNIEVWDLELSGVEVVTGDGEVADEEARWPATAELTGDFAMYDEGGALILTLQRAGVD